MFRGTPCSRIKEILVYVVLHLSQNTKYYLFIDSSNHDWTQRYKKFCMEKKHHYTRAKIDFLCLVSEFYKRSKEYDEFFGSQDILTFKSWTFSFPLNSGLFSLPFIPGPFPVTFNSRSFSPYLKFQVLFPLSLIPGPFPPLPLIPGPFPLYL